MNTKSRKSKASTIIIILLLCIIIVLAGIIVYQYLKEDADKNNSESFSYSSDNSVDPYGLTGENNILGEVIVAALQDYIIRNQCDYEIDEDSCAFIFKDISYPYGTSPELIIYTDYNTSIVDTIEYRFDLDDGFFGQYYTQKINKYLYDYYDVTPIYFHVTDNGFNEITYEQYDSLFLKDIEATYDTLWNTDSLLICFSTTKSHYGTYCSIGFTLNN